MVQAQTLKELCQSILRYVGNGYIYYKISHIPIKKAHKTVQIRKRVSDIYQTNLSQGKRQYRRKQKIANYQAISFRGMIIIFRTAGTHKDNPNEFKKINSKGLELIVSEHLKLILFKDERKKWTYRLSKENYTFFSGEVKKSCEKRNGNRFYKIRKMFNNLPRYKGIERQKKELNILLKILYKQHHIKNWSFI